MDKSAIIRELLVAERDMIEAIHCLIGDIMRDRVTEDTARNACKFIHDNADVVWEACA